VKNRAGARFFNENNDFTVKKQRKGTIFGYSGAWETNRRREKRGARD
jgi:hypothetical protein